MGKTKFKVGDQIILEKVEDGWIAKIKGIEVDHHFNLNTDFKDFLDFLEKLVIRE